MTKDMLGAVVRKIVDLPMEALGTICDLAEKLSGEGGREWLGELKKFLRKEKCWISMVRETFLRLVSGGETLIIDAVDGTETLADATDVFAWIDPDFKNWGADEPGPATGKTQAVVYEMVKNGTFADMFGSLNGDIRRLCFTQAQIKLSVKKHRNWLRDDGYGTFFFFQSKGEFFVADVALYSGGRLNVHVLRLENSLVWNAVRRPRLVAPQLAL
ncbi:MAG: hypothetical protein V1867_01185 [Candidatus Falkowbacteria bacterium]